MAVVGAGVGGGGTGAHTPSGLKAVLVIFLLSVMSLYLIMLLFRDQGFFVIL